MKKRVYVAGPISKPDTPEGLCRNVKQADVAMLALLKAGFAVFNPMLSVFCGGVEKRWASVSVASCDGLGDVGQYEVVASAHRQANDGFREISHQDWLDMDFAWIEVCHALLRLPGESKGADMEVAFAKERGIPVFYSIDDLVSHFKKGNAAPKDCNGGE